MTRGLASLALTLGLLTLAGCVERRFVVTSDPPGAIVLLNGRRIKVVKRRVFQRQRHTATVNLRGLPKGTFKLKITVLTSAGASLTGTRKYHTCTKKRRSKRPPKL